MIEEDEINLLDYWRVLVKRKRLLSLIVGMAAIASVIISLLLPKIYASTTTLLPPEDNSAGALGLISSLPSGLGGLAGGLLGKSSPGDLWVGILESQTIRDEIINRFNLRDLYEAESIEDAREELDNAVKIEKSKEGIVSITVEDKNPEQATQMARAFVEELDKVNKSIVMTSGGRMRAFVEGRLNEAKVLLAGAEETLKTFQEQNRAVKLDAQSEAIIEAIGNVKGHLMAKEVELQTLLSFATSRNPQVEILKTEIKELKKGLKDLEVGKGGTLASSKSIFIPTSRIPDLGLKYARLLREAKIQETLFELLTQQYEMARIQEAKDTPTVQVLDVAKVPEKKAKPKRTLIVLLSTFTAGFFGVFLVFFLEYIEKVSVESRDA